MTAPRTKATQKRSENAWHACNPEELEVMVPASALQGCRSLMVQTWYANTNQDGNLKPLHWEGTSSSFGGVFWMEANWGQYMNRSYCNYTTILFSGDIQVVKTCLDTTTLQSDEDPGTSDLRVYSFSLPLEQNLHIQVVGQLTPRTRENLDLLFKGWTFGSVTFEKKHQIQRG